MKPVDPKRWLDDPAAELQSVRRLLSHGPPLEPLDSATALRVKQRVLQVTGALGVAGLDQVAQAAARPLDGQAARSRGPSGGDASVGSTRPAAARQIDGRLAGGRGMSPAGEAAGADAGKRAALQATGEAAGVCPPVDGAGLRATVQRTVARWLGVPATSLGPVGLALVGAALTGAALSYVAVSWSSVAGSSARWAKPAMGYQIGPAAPSPARDDSRAPVVSAAGSRAGAPRSAAIGAVESGAVESGAVESGAVESGAMESSAVESGAVESGAVESHAGARSDNSRRLALESRRRAGISEAAEPAGPAIPADPGRAATAEGATLGARFGAAGARSPSAHADPALPPPKNSAQRASRPSAAPTRAAPGALPGAARAPSAAATQHARASIRSAQGERRARGSSAEAPRRAGADSLREETRLLEAAKSHLARNPREALALSQQHQQRFRGGQLLEQRRLIQLEALLRLGQEDAALAVSQRLRHALSKSRAEALLERYGVVTH